ncbi:MAG: cytochrome c oxidase assembly protein [Methylocystis sp.]|uniref:cytochrome c oxidase assembly protein n=1 Tax=Methylocystis sp. TaxID=1911079 RepID=UPI003D13C928
MVAPAPRSRNRPRLVAAALIVGAAAMLGLSFASVPLYRAFCAATGFGGTPKTNVAGPPAVGERVLTVRFDANVARDLPWRFEPEVAKVSLRTGETKTVYYKVANLSDRETTGQAAYNVAPGQAGAFFVKVACFCFEEKRLGPHEAEEWPVVFYLDPALEREEGMRNVHEITLSYTFFATKDTAASKTGEAASARPKG